ncbi:hypothetical protein LVY75_35465 (plasmid) [Sinorhizobium sp. B11]|jgi:hypothetical protein
MRQSRHSDDDELVGVITEKLTALIRALEDADWSADDVVFAIEDVLNKNWLEKARALRTVRETMPDNFVSDGNEG